MSKILAFLQSTISRSDRFDAVMKSSVIPLTKEQSVVVDQDDYWLLRMFKWHFDNGYASNKDLGAMHRFLMNDPVDLHVDHIDGNRLNNRRANLRAVTPQQNQSNRRNGRGISKYVGVSWEVRFERWKVSVTHLDKAHYVGVFRDEVEAAKAYNVASIRLRGEHAGINVIDGYTANQELAKPKGNKHRPRVAA